MSSYPFSRNLLRDLEMAEDLMGEAVRGKADGLAALAAEHAETVAEISALWERILTIAGVRARLEMAGKDTTERFYIVGSPPSRFPDRNGRPRVVFDGLEVELCRSVRWGGHVVDSKVRVALFHRPEVRGNPEHLSTLLELLRKHAENPAGAKLSGAFCYCARSLTDEESRRRGYGKDCAASYRRPWGQGAGR